MALITARNIRLAFGPNPILDGVDLLVRQGDRLCLLGRNGAGKSSLLSILARVAEPDAGEVQRAKGLSVGFLPQEAPDQGEGTVYDVAVQGLEHGPAWAGEGEVLAALSHLGLDPDAKYAGLSGGGKRKTLLARALAAAPDVLLLDEPTNHLDMDTVAWLEETLLRLTSRGMTLLFVSHDRAFIRRLSTRVVELDRGQLYDFGCDYTTYLRRKETVLAAEDNEWNREDKKLAAEEVWLRQGVTARRTRNQGRLRALLDLRAKRDARRQRTGRARLNLLEAESSGKMIVEAKHVTFGHDKERTPLVRDLSLRVQRGDRLGLVGRSGLGKTSLLGLLLGALEPDQGTIRQGERLEIAYFDQLRAEIDDEASIRANVSGEDDYVTTSNGKRHVVGYLNDFLFHRDNVNQKARYLSGGERNRLLLAKLFCIPSNVLVLDEPTNDLDMDTLELLETLLGEYSGTVLFVSHDREFINNVATQVLHFQGDGRIVEYAGGWDDLLAQQALDEEKPSQDRQARKRPAREGAPSRPGKLGFKEKRALEMAEQEYATMEGAIERLEAELETAQQALADPDLYTSGGDEVVAAKARMEEAENALEQAFARWEELETMLALHDRLPSE